MNRLCSIFVIAVLLPGANLFAQSRAERPNDFTIELGGRCLIYSLSYQRTINKTTGLEFGISMLGGSDASALFLSGGGRFYLTRKNAAPCIAAGIVFLTTGTDAGPFSEDFSGVYVYLSPGFEFRSQAGFVFRGAVYFLIREGFFVWPGLTLGIAF